MGSPQRALHMRHMCLHSETPWGKGLPITWLLYTSLYVMSWRALCIETYSSAFSTFKKMFLKFEIITDSQEIEAQEPVTWFHPVAPSRVTV